MYDNYKTLFVLSTLRLLFPFDSICILLFLLTFRQRARSIQNPIPLPESQEESAVCSIARQQKVIMATR